MGQVCGNVNRNLKWAFVEIGNLIVVNQRWLAGTHVAKLYQRIKRVKNHQKAVVAVARHLAEAAWWVLKAGVPEPNPSDIQNLGWHEAINPRGLGTESPEKTPLSSLLARPFRSFSDTVLSSDPCLRPQLLHEPIPPLGCRNHYSASMG